MNKKINKEKVEKLVFCAQDGSTNAFGELYDIFVDQIYRYILIKTGNHMDAEDITSESFKRAWISIKKYKKNNFRAYLYKIATNVCMDHFRKQSKNVSIENGFQFPDKKAGVEETLIKKQDIKKLYLAIKKLPRNFKEVITLRYIEELSVAETAKVLGKSGVAVRVTQHRAIKALKRSFIKCKHLRKEYEK